jgi:UDP-galactopyranose mutase
MDIVCFSHLRWDFVFQRPQHLLTRLATHFRIFYVEEPLFRATHDHYSETTHGAIHTIKLHIKDGPEKADVNERLQTLLLHLFRSHKVMQYIFWYYTPMALPMTTAFTPVLTIYDCMDELSAFQFAPPSLSSLEKQLLSKADVVFTGGHSLYEAKRHQHRNIHSFPSSIDKKHFSRARRIRREPADQQAVPDLRFGFYGVLDERFDIDLIRSVAEKKPEWNFVLVGPVVKIDPASLPQRSNIFYLGSKSYAELPAYLAGWDVAMVSFALNASTRFISPTKTPEYLAAGKPVISTPITDVVNTYGRPGLVHIVRDADEFIAAGTKLLSCKNDKQWLRQVDKFLAHDSWDRTVGQMHHLIDQALARKKKEMEQFSHETFTAHYLVADSPLPAAS